MSHPRQNNNSNHITGDAVDPDNDKIMVVMSNWPSYYNNEIITLLILVLVIWVYKYTLLMIVYIRFRVWIIGLGAVGL